LVKQTFTRIDKMLIKIGYNIALKFASPTAVIHLLHVHLSRRSHLVEPERLGTDPDLSVEECYDRFGKHRGRIYAPVGSLRLFSKAVIRGFRLAYFSPDNPRLGTGSSDLRLCPLPSHRGIVDFASTSDALIVKAT
jgi:hypothetical protein